MYAYRMQFFLPKRMYCKFQVARSTRYFDNAQTLEVMGLIFISRRECHALLRYTGW